MSPCDVTRKWTLLTIFSFKILSQEYSRVANVTAQEAAAGRINVSVVGFSMGNAWIAPDLQSMSYGPLLYQLVNYPVRIQYEI